jgi:hypothetical protein
MVVVVFMPRVQARPVPTGSACVFCRLHVHRRLNADKMRLARPLLRGAFMEPLKPPQILAVGAAIMATVIAFLSLA